MPTISPDSQFRLIQDTRAINLIPNTYGRIQQLGLFREEGSVTTSIKIVSVNGVLTLLSALPRGSEPLLNQNETRNIRTIEALHFPLTDRVRGEDIQNVVDWNTGESFDTITAKVARSFVNMRKKHAITKEYISMGALKGLVVNDDESTLIDLYAEFGITKKTITIPLSVGTTNVRAYCHQILRHMEDNLLGETMSGAEVWCSEEFFDALVEHEQVQKTYLNYYEAATRIGGDVRMGFTYGGIKFSEYRAVTTDKTGVSRRFIAPNYAHAFPLGTTETFEMHYAPPVLNGINNANTRGVEVYALQTPDPKGRWIDVDTESNPLPLCRRPGLLVEITHS